MAKNDLEGETVARGRWLYAGSVWKSIEVVASDCDYFFERLPMDDGRANWDAPIPLTVEGVLYYLKLDGDVLPVAPFTSVADAKAWATAQPWGPVEWGAP